MNHLLAENPAPIFVLAVLFIAGAIGIAFYFNHLRKKHLEEWAAANGFRFYMGKARPKNVLPDFQTLKRGHSHRLKHIFQGEWQGHAALFADFQWTTGSGKNQSTHSASIAVLELPRQVDGLMIREEHFGDRITAFFGFDDIDFESAQFSDRFHVSSPKKRWAYDVVNPKNMERLLGEHDYSYEFMGDKAIIFNGDVWKGPDIAYSFDLLAAFIGDIPKIAYDVA